jgi:hypothetical protein
MSDASANDRAQQTNLSPSRALDGNSANAASIPAVDTAADRRSDSGNGTGNRDCIAPPAQTSRRGFLMNTMVSAASLATGTAVFVPPNARAAPTSCVDPIFARIEEYRAAAKALHGAAAEYHSHEDTLIEQGLGLSPFVSVLEMRIRPGRAQPVMVYQHEYVDVHIPPDRFSELNAAAHTELDAKFEQHKAIVGDSEKVMYAAMDVEDEALDAVVGTSPTSAAGLLAMLEFLRSVREIGEMTVDRTEALLNSLADAVRALHPDVVL